MIRWTGNAPIERLRGVRRIAAGREIPMTLERAPWPLRRAMGHFGAYREGVGQLVGRLRDSFDPGQCLSVALWREASERSARGPASIADSACLPAPPTWPLETRPTALAVESFSCAPSSVERSSPMSRRSSSTSMRVWAAGDASPFAPPA